MVNDIISKFEKFGIISHGLPNAIGLWPNEQECLVWTALQASQLYDWMEIGSFCGGSTILLALAKQRENVIAVDKSFNPMFDFNVFTRGKLHDKVVKLECDSCDILKYYDNKISFLFIDGYHSFIKIMDEFRLLRDIMTTDCIIAFHDVSPNMVEHDEKYINKCYEAAVCNYSFLSNDTSENFRVDEAIAMICKEYGYTIMDIPIRDNKTYFKETRLKEWVRGTTSPFNAFTAIQRI